MPPPLPGIGVVVVAAAGNHGDAQGGNSRPYPAAYARWREGESQLAARGDRAAVVATLRIALATADELGADPLAAEITALAARARLDLGSAASDDEIVETTEAERLGLTPRELGVLALVALGRTNRQIADELFISQNTAGVHVSNIIGKLGVAGRGEAAALAYRRGLTRANGPRDVSRCFEAARSRRAAASRPPSGAGR